MVHFNVLYLQDVRLVHHVIYRFVCMYMHVFMNTCVCVCAYVYLGIYYSRNGGSSWTSSTGGYPTAGIYWTSIASSNTGQYVVAGFQYGSSAGQLWTSIDYGQSFAQSATYSTNQYFQFGNLAMSSDGTKIIAGVYGLGVLLYNCNGAVTPIGSTLASVNSASVIYVRGVSSDSTFSRLTFGVESGKLIAYCTSSFNDVTLNYYHNMIYAIVK